MAAQLEKCHYWSADGIVGRRIWTYFDRWTSGGFFGVDGPCRVVSVGAGFYRSMWGSISLSYSLVSGGSGTEGGKRDPSTTIYGDPWGEACRLCSYLFLFLFLGIDRSIRYLYLKLPMYLD